MRDPFLKKGHVFNGPDGQGYTITRDVYAGDVISYYDFQPFGGAPEPAPREMMVDWLCQEINEVFS